MARDRDDDSGRVSGLFRPDGTFWMFRKRFDQVGRDAGCNVDGITASRFTRLVFTGLTVSNPIDVLYIPTIALPLLSARLADPGGTMDSKQG